MEARFDYRKVAPGVFEAMLGLTKYLKETGLEEKLLDLVSLRGVADQRMRVLH